jgi:single-strand DNA-binding protein
MELNKVFLIGNLTQDPESRHLQSGAQVCKLRLACNRRTGGGQGGERKDEVLYIDVEAWQRTAELCAQYLRKGSNILVEGRLKLDQYQTQTGENRSKIFVVADRVQFGPRNDGSGAAPRQSGGGAPPRSQATSAAPSNSGFDDYGDSGNYGDGPTEDDLPF